MVVATFTSEKALKNWLAEENIYEGKLKAIEHLMTFPSEWTVNDEEVIIQGSLRKFHSWVEQLDNQNREIKFQQIDEKLIQLMS